MNAPKLDYNPPAPQARGGLKEIIQLSSPVPKPLVPKPSRPIPNPVQLSPKAQLVPRGLGLTLKSYGPPTHPTTPPPTFKHEGGL